MPISGYTDKNTHCTEDVMLMRARLHLVTGKRRLREGKISLGLVTIYDALYSAMQWYIGCPEYAGKLVVKPADNLKEDNNLFTILFRSGVITSGFDYRTFSKLVEAALYKNMTDFNYSGILTDIESIMTQLGALPFDESELTPYDADEPQDY